ncbi:MAG TPA: ABC transporter ATP-binding protein [Thermomicrobiaceae bacterium]|nr:ABC transporter ATP-binding protein [Thermomicrobiaceae bacterium]
MSDDNERWMPPERRRRAADAAAPVSPPPVAPAPAPPREPVADREPEPAAIWARPAAEARPVGAAPAASAATSPPRSRPAVVIAPIVDVEGVSRDYPMGDGIVHALKPVTLKVPRGQLVAVHGRSGSGKTTLLNLIGGLDRPTAGRVWVDGIDVTVLPERELVALRRHTIGFIFQTFGLIPILTAAENVEIPLRLANVDVVERDERVRVLLELVGLGERARHRPFELSGGEQQRVAIARALANGPKLLIADEPTGQLDSGTARSIMTLIRALVKSEGVTAIVATHDPVLIDLADRVVELRDGEVIADSW